MHITLTGNLGSGKSTITKIMSEKYGYEIYSTGKIIRQLAEERGLTVLEMNRLMESDHSYDNLIDETTRKISLERSEDIFFDSRLAWNFAVNTFKVFLTVDINEAARRVFNDNRGNVETYTSVENAREQLLERAHTEDDRYREIYGIEYFKISNYNLMLDSTSTSPQTLAETILREKEKYEEAIKSGNVPPCRVLLSPARLCGMAPNTVDNNFIMETDAVVSHKIEGFSVLSGMDVLQDAAAKGYEFVSVRY